MAKEKAAATVQKASDGWAFMHPETHEWTGQFKTRDEARAARTALGKTQNKPAKATKIETEKVVDNAETAPVDSSSVESASPVTTQNMNQTSEKEIKMASTLALTPDTKARKSTSLVFKAGPNRSVRAAKTLFPNGKPLEGATYSLVCDQENGFAQPKQKLSAEERKAARANAPKLTPAQKLAKLQERAAKLQAKIDAGAGAQPSA